MFCFLTVRVGFFFHRFLGSDLMGQPPPATSAPGVAGTSTSYGRAGGSVPYGGPPRPPPVAVYPSGGRGSGTAPSAGNFNGYPPFQPPSGRFDMGRGGGGRMANGHFGGDRRGDGGRGGGRGRSTGRGDSWRGFDSSRGRGGGGGSRSFDGGRDGGRGFGGRGGSRGGRHGSSSSSSSSRGDLDNVALPRQDFGSLVPFEKNLYVESASVRAMSEHEVMIYRSRREITVEGHDVPKPIRMFEETNFPGDFVFWLWLQ